MSNQNPHKALYNSARWKRLRANQLGLRPLCGRCERAGRLVEATVVNHIVPHQGDFELFHDPDNLESVCKPCHDGVIQHQEKTGRDYDPTIGFAGLPVDPNHPFNQGAA